MKYIILSIVFLGLYSCNSTSSESNKQENKWCDYLAFGTFEGETNDGLKIHVKFEQINEHPYYNESDGFFISLELPNGKEVTPEGGTKFVDFFEIRGSSKDIKFNEPIKLEPDALTSDNEYLYDSDFELGEIGLTYISGDKLKLDFPKAQEAIQKLTSSKVNEEINSIVLTKTRGLSECFDPKASFNSFTEHEKSFVVDNLEIRNDWNIADKELIDYFFNHNYAELWEYTKLVDIGSVFKLDLNQDGEDDICGYFSHKYDDDKELVFKIFLNNGVAYEEAYSVNMNDNSLDGSLGAYFVPDELNDKPVVFGNIPDKGGYSLFFNKLSGKIVSTNDEGENDVSTSSQKSTNTKTSNLKSFGEIRAELINSKNPNSIENLLGKADEEYIHGEMNWYLYYFKAQRNGVVGHLKCTYRGIWGGQVDEVEFYTPGSTIRIGAQYLVSP